MNTHHGHTQAQVPNVHELARDDARCGYSQDTARAARMVRGIKACATVLFAEREESLELGAYLRSGLIEAIDELTHEVGCELDALSEAIIAGKKLW